MASVPLKPLSSFPKASPEDTLDAAFSSVTSSHDAVFVFDREGAFRGIASPGMLLFKTRTPGGAKVGSSLVHPPRVDSNTSLSKIAEFMTAARIYQLPVFDEDGTIKGVVTAQDLLQSALQDRDFFSALREVRPETVPVASIQSSVKDLYNHMRNEHQSRICLVNEAGTLEGIITRRDIQQFLIKPSDFQRLKTGGKPQGARSFVFGREKESRLRAAASEWCTRDVLQASYKTSMVQVLKLLSDSGKNSVVLVDGKFHPVGIISYRTVLKLLAATPSEALALAVKNSANLPAGDMDHVRDAASRTIAKLQKRASLRRLEITIKDQKSAAGRPLEFEIAAQALFSSGDTLVGTAKGKTLIPAVRAALKRIEEQERRIRLP